MPFLTRNKNIQPVQPIAPAEPIEERSFYSDALNFNSVSSYVSSKNLRLSTVFACTDILSNGIATLPINIYEVDETGFKKINYQHPLNKLLNLQPSTLFSSYNFFKSLINSLLLKGNAYALINKDNKGNIIEIRYLPFEWVTVNYNWQLDKINYTVLGYPKPIESINILHFWQYTEDYVHGVSVIDYAINTLKSASDAENHAANFFKSGAASNGLLKSEKKLDDTQKRDIKNAWFSAFNDPTTSGIALIPNGLEYQSISINPKDSMLLESRQYSVIDICRFFRVSPVKVFDLTHSSYSSLEQTNLDFYETSLKPLIILIENEFNRKFFSDSTQSIKFDVTDMLSTDKITTANYYKTLLDSGVLTVNEVRKQLNFSEIETGNENYIQLNMATLTNINKGVVAPEQVKEQQKTALETDSTDTNITDIVE